jgi:hypothetical protein
MILPDDPPLTEPPTNVGEYRVTVFVPNDNHYFAGEITFDFEITPAPITKAGVLVGEPLVFATPNVDIASANAVTGVLSYPNPVFTTGLVSWTFMENDIVDTMTESERFIAGREYTATVTFTATSNFTFEGITEDDVSINGKKTTIDGTPGETLTIYHTFGVMEKIELIIGGLEAKDVEFNNQPYEICENNATLSLADSNYPVVIPDYVLNDLLDYLVFTYMRLSGTPATVSDAVDAGAYRVTICVPDNPFFKGSVSFDFDITPAPITKAEIEITEPSVFAEPSLTPNVTYNGDLFTVDEVRWEPQHERFQADTVYTVTVTLSANTNFTFIGIEEDDVLINSEKATIVGDPGSTITISYTFPSDDMNKIGLDIIGLVRQDGYYTGNPHDGYAGTFSVSGSSIVITPNELALLEKQLEIIYDTILPSGTFTQPPTDAGEYTVTLSIPDDNPFFTGSVSISFTIHPPPPDAPSYAPLVLYEITYIDEGANDDDGKAEIIAEQTSEAPDDYTVTVTAHGNHPKDTDYAMSGTLFGHHIIKEEDEEEKEEEDSKSV